MNIFNQKLIVIKTSSLFLLCFIALFNISCGQTKAEKIDELISLFNEYGSFNGSILVAEHGEIIYKNGFGFANFEWDIPNQTDTKHRLASVSKQFTAMVIMQLVAEGKLALDVPISTYLADYPQKNGDIINIHHLLTHTSGIPNYTSFQNYWEMMRNPISPAGLVATFADSTLLFTPGERFDYSNSGYVLLGHIIEQLTGKAYEDVLQEKILDPLGMKNTGFDHNSELLKARAGGYFKRGSRYFHANYIDMSVPFTAGAMYSTVEDLFLWDQALYTEKLLPQQYLDMIFAKHIPSNGGYYGYGWDIDEMYQGSTSEMVQTISHSGGINGFNTRITRIPADKSSIIILNNTSGAPISYMTRAITGILYDQPYDYPLQSIANSLPKVIEEKGISAAIKFVKEVNGSTGYYLSENEMNLLAYEYLQAEKLNIAEPLFKLNVELFPTAFNVYDSYGEILLVLGKEKEGIENYKKSIQLNPDNNNAYTVLEDLGVETAGLVPKLSDEYLMLLQGSYLAVEQPANRKEEWKILIEAEEGNLYGKDGNYRYRLVPLEEDKFVNPDDGATLDFNTDDKGAISFVIFGRYTFKKVE